MHFVTFYDRRNNERLMNIVKSIDDSGREYHFSRWLRPPAFLMNGTVLVLVCKFKNGKRDEFIRMHCSQRSNMSRMMQPNGDTANDSFFEARYIFRSNKHVSRSMQPVITFGQHLHMKTLHVGCVGGWHTVWNCNYFWLGNWHLLQ